MGTYRTVWTVVATVTVALAAVATVLAVPLGVYLASAFALATFGGLIALTLSEDLTGVRWPVAKGAALASVPALVPGLSRVAGPAGTTLAVLVVVASPWIVVRVGRWVGRWVLPPGLVQAGMADPDDALRRQWEESTRQLRRARTITDRMVVVRVRQQILDDVAERSDGPLPPFVWVLPDGPGGLDHPARDGRRPG